MRTLCPPSYTYGWAQQNLAISHSTLEYNPVTMRLETKQTESTPAEQDAFKAYPKTVRLEAETITISEKIDGTNGLIFVSKGNESEKMYVKAGSRSKWLVDDGSKSWDNHGFGAWVKENETELLNLPAGMHYGEWYGKGINSGYGMTERKFMLFNKKRYSELEDLPSCVELETILEENVSIDDLTSVLYELRRKMTLQGSYHVPTCINGKMVEGVILRFKLAGKIYKEVWNKS